MTRSSCFKVGLAVAITALAGILKAAAQMPALSLQPSQLPRLGTVDERFQSYNLEMVEVTGGNFWKPYRASASAPSGPGAAGAVNPDLYEYRAPIDLANPRLRMLAAALAPAYVRVSGTWANSTYFAESDETPATPPRGFNSVLSRERWRGVVDFAHAVDAGIVTSMAISPGVRDAAGLWQSDQARRFIAYTKSIGGRIAAAEFMNEPNLAAMGGAPKGYDAAAYGRDFNAFHAFIKASEPDIILLGPGSIGETAATQSSSAQSGSGEIRTRDLLAVSGPGIDAFSYHHYGALSQRCSGVPGQTTPEAALSEEWLASTDRSRAFYQALRDASVPGRPLWVTETADAACGGNPWASTFLDTFRYLDQLGRLARAGVQVVAHNTLAASDYGLLDQQSFRPRPNYWAALLWRRLMGTTVLDAGARHGTHVYAHCRRGVPGAVTLLVINTDRTAAATLRLPLTSERYTLSADHLQSPVAKLNGTVLELDRNGLPDFAAVTSSPGSLEIAPATMTFVTIAGAGNSACD